MNNCLWSIYQSNPTYENCCHFLKRQACCRMERDDWLTRKLPESFFAEAGYHSEEQSIKLFEEIPDGFKKLAYTIIIASQISSGLSSCIAFRHFLFATYDDLLKVGIDLKLPHYWYADGVMIPPEYIVRITNGIVGWVCDESSKRCMMEGECRYFKKSEV